MGWIQIIKLIVQGLPPSPKCLPRGLKRKVPLNAYEMHSRAVRSSYFISCSSMMRKNPANIHKSIPPVRDQS